MSDDFLQEGLPLFRAKAKPWPSRPLGGVPEPGEIEESEESRVSAWFRSRLCHYKGDIVIRAAGRS